MWCVWYAFFEHLNLMGALNATLTACRLDRHFSSRDEVRNNKMAAISIHILLLVCLKTYFTTLVLHKTLYTKTSIFIADSFFACLVKKWNGSDAPATRKFKCNV